MPNEENNEIVRMLKQLNTTLFELQYKINEINKQYQQSLGDKSPGRKGVMSRAKIEQVWESLTDSPESAMTVIEIARDVNFSAQTTQKALYTLLAEGRAKRQPLDTGKNVGRPTYQYYRLGASSAELGDYVNSRANKRFDMERLKAAIPHQVDQAMSIAQISAVIGASPATVRQKILQLSAAGVVKAVKLKTDHNQPVMKYYSQTLQ
jgi:predicted ArsR family transcriptional regulator